MEIFSALLAICVQNSPVTGEFPAQRPVTRSFDIFFGHRPNKRLSKQSWGWWLEAPSHPLWRQCNAFWPQTWTHNRNRQRRFQRERDSTNYNGPERIVAFQNEPKAPHSTSAAIVVIRCAATIHWTFQNIRWASTVCRASTYCNELQHSWRF